jgi:hypothetical protein
MDFLFFNLRFLESISNPVNPVNPVEKVFAFSLRSANLIPESAT